MNKLYRVLVRIEDIFMKPFAQIPACVVVVIGSWNPKRALIVPLEKLPDHIKEALPKIDIFPFRTHAQFTLGADNLGENYEFGEWEPIDDKCLKENGNFQHSKYLREST